MGFPIHTGSMIDKWPLCSVPVGNSPIDIANTAATKIHPVATF